MENTSNLYQLAGKPFDANAFFKKPATLFKTASLILGALLWYVVSTGGYHKMSGSVHHQVCLYGGSATTCSFASALGFFAMIGALTSMWIDVRFEKESSIPTRQRMVTADLIVALCFAGIHLIAFFSFWSKIDSSIDENVNTNYVKMGVLAALLATLTWAGCSLYAYRKYAAFKLDSGIDKMESNGQMNNGGTVNFNNASYQDQGAPATNQQADVPTMSDGYGY